MSKLILILKGESGVGKTFLAKELCKTVGTLRVPLEDYLQGQKLYIDALNEPEAKMIVVDHAKDDSQEKFFKSEAEKRSFQTLSINVQ
jgi:MoxR-like ATPase